MYARGNLNILEVVIQNICLYKCILVFPSLALRELSKYINIFKHVYLLIRREMNLSADIFTEDLYIIKSTICTQNLLVYSSLVVL